MKYFSLAVLSALFLFLPAGAMEHITSLDKELFSAIQKGDAAQVESALKKGANVNSLDYEGRTPLIVAILAREIPSNQRRAIIRFLMISGADTNTADQLGETPLRTAIALEDEATVSQLIAGRGKKANVNQADTNGETPLMLAARIGNYNIARMLIQQHADKNLVDNEGNTALSIAKASDHEDIIKLLSGQHAQPKQQRTEGHRYETNETFGVLLDVLKTNDPQGIKHGTNFNIVNPSGLTFLGFAAAEQKVKDSILHALIEAGSDINFVSPETGRTPLMDFLSLIRSNMGYSFILQRIKFFVENGANVNHRDNQGNTPLMLALALERIPESLMEELLDSGAHVNVANSLGITPLSIVIRQLAEHAARDDSMVTSYVSLAELLIGYGATFNEEERKVLEPYWVGSVMHQMVTNDPELEVTISHMGVHKQLKPLLFAIGIGNNTAARLMLANMLYFKKYDVVIPALKRAIIVGNLEIVKEILESKIINTDQLTHAIETAVLAGKINILRYLLAQDPNHAVDLSYAITLARNQVRSSQQTTHQALYDLLMAHSLPSQQGPQLPQPSLITERSFWDYMFGGKKG